ncbi:hypothetical protein ELY21_14695 [Legionella sp. km535]|uniref:hypothetical protein n=1 Tax=Legionella sp. km535 TaxID=2498107 RepID=UPI000F8DE271|nr:hypothetical protein [Legionella sp. km535]RUR15408.1 hypothetical protein ELY21_14695 [Legionella sp. km535]
MIKQLNILMNKIKNPFAMLSGAFWFTIENYRKRYPHVLLGEKSSGTHVNCEETILLYRIVGKRYIFESSASEICNSKELISKFHPLDVRVISFIAGIEQILKTKPEESLKKFESLKESIFSKCSNRSPNLHHIDP